MKTSICSSKILRQLFKNWKSAKSTLASKKWQNVFRTLFPTNILQFRIAIASPDFSRGDGQRLPSLQVAPDAKTSICTSKIWNTKTKKTFPPFCYWKLAASTCATNNLLKRMDSIPHCNYLCAQQKSARSNWTCKTLKGTIFRLVCNIILAATSLDRRACNS